MTDEPLIPPVPGDQEPLIPPVPTNANGMTDDEIQALRHFQQFVLEEADKFSRIKTNLYATSVPLDDALLAERINAIENLLETLTYMLEHLEHGTISPIALQY
jgi:hypothetical protein